jgi:hypothetical protein
MEEKTLKVGERVRLVRLPPVWAEPWHHVPWSTREAYRRLMARRRPLRVDLVDEFGAWVRGRLRSRAGRIHEHLFVLDEGCWVRVMSRKGRRAR